MPLPSPKVDPRNYGDIVRQTEVLAQQFTATTSSPWRPSAGDAPDAGSALISIFSRLAELVIDRLNQAPEKHFLAFLNLIGTQPLPPNAARAPLTFELATGSTTAGLVGAGTRAAAPAQGTEDEVIFETERDLVVTPVKLQGIFVREPSADRYRAYAPALATESSFPVFDGDQPIEHSLYITHDDLLLLPGRKTVTLFFESPDPTSLATLDITWSYWSGRHWQPLDNVSSSVTEDQWQVVLQPVPQLLAHSIDGRQAGWLRGSLNTPLPSTATTLPTLHGVTMQVVVTGTDIAPQRGFAANGQLIDFTQDFYPFGERPRPNDAFYLASDEVLAKSAAQITLHLTLSDPPPVALKPSNSLRLNWEVWHGDGWQVLAVNGEANVVKLIESGSVTFTLPERLSPRTVNGEHGYWLRVRIVAGHYGSELTTTWDDRRNTLVTTGGFGPPSLAAVRLDYRYIGTAPELLCKTYNDFSYADHRHDFQPFTPSQDTRPTLYMGFDGSFNNRPTTLYARVDPGSSGTRDRERRVAARTDPARLVWEYSGVNSWRPLAVVDETNAFATSDLIQFIGPKDFSPRLEFGESLYWLRVRWESGVFATLPRLQGLFTNTMWASQATTLSNEILGSSSGEPNQIFPTAQTPVLAYPPARLQVREPAMPPTQERQRLQAAAGGEAIDTLFVPDGQSVWVRWQRVADFHGSGPRDRHYVLDALSGEVRFGDGRRGMAPPQGRDNIRLAHYHVGGGLRGNRTAGSVTQLKTTIPYVAAVSHRQAGGGGADAETIERVKARGPKTLRHRQRAVTAQDFEDLVFEASPAVVRARAMTPMFNPVDQPWLPMFHFRPQGPGPIKVTLNWQSDQSLTIQLCGPGQNLPYAQTMGHSPLEVVHRVEATQFQPGDLWYLTVINHNDTFVNGVVLKVDYPVGMIDSTFQAPARSGQPIDTAGQVEVIIVPDESGPQPMPSLMLINQVESYLQARCPAGIDLWVSAPDWLEVTVTATITPISLEAANQVRGAVVAALNRFLHPLTGGREGHGWPFGRQPYKSDLYGVVESVAGVDYVHSLSVAGLDTQIIHSHRFLIFSGQHEISLRI